MKSILLLLLGFVLATPGVCQQDGSPPKSDLENDSLKGRVKTITLKRSTLVGNMGALLDTPAILVLVQSHDEKGRLVSIESYREGKLRRRTTYFDLGIYRARRLEDFPAEITDPKLDKTSKPTKPPCGAPGDFALKTKYEYDTKGNKSGEEVYDACDVLKSKTTFKYNTAGRLEQTKETTYLYKSPVERITNFAYDQSGNLIEAAQKNIYTDEFFNYEFDAQGNWIKRRVVSTKFLVQLLPEMPAMATNTLIEYRTIAYY